MRHLLRAATLISALSTAAFTLGAAQAQAPAAPAAEVPKPADAPRLFDDAQTKAIGEIVREYLLANPDVLIEVSKLLEERQARETAARRVEGLKALYAEETPYSLGEGDVTIVEFFDYNCPYCRSAFNHLLEATQKDKKMRVVFIDLPIFDDSPPIIRASLASAKQGKYFEFHQAMMAHKGRLTEADALRIAGEIGLDVEKLKKDMASPEIAQEVLKNLRLAQALGVNSTPAFFVGDATIDGAPESAQQLIEAVEEVRKNGCEACAAAKPTADPKG